MSRPQLPGSARRRTVLKTLASAAIAPVVIPSSAIGRDGSTAPSERLTTELFTDAPGLKSEGTKGFLLTRGWRAPLTSNKFELLETVLPEEQRLRRPRTDGQGGEHMDFTDAIKEGRDAYAPAEIGHRTIFVAHIGNIAMQLGRKLRWNPYKEKFVGDDAANAMLSRKQREPWAIKNIDYWLNVG